MTKFKFTKKWCREAAKREDGCLISAGVPDPSYHDPSAPTRYVGDGVAAKAEQKSWKFRRTGIIHRLVALGVEPSKRRDAALALVRGELTEAAKNFHLHSSAHESYAVLLEEMDELKAEVWKRQDQRDYEALAKEAVQVAAMALRFLTDICFVHPAARGREVKKLDQPIRAMPLLRFGPKSTRFFSKRPLTKEEIAYGKKLAKEVEKRARLKHRRNAWKTVDRKIAKRS